MYTRTTIIGLIVCAAVGVAQQSAHRTRPYPPNGKVVLELTPRGEPTSLGQLITMSHLIVDGTVISALPAVSTHRDPDVPAVETHSLITVNTVVSGTVPNGAGTVVLAQTGGKAGKWDVTVSNDQLVAQGEHYILFLARDERKELPNNSGMPRYAVVGVWSGKAKVVNGKVQFLAGAHPELHKYDNSDVSEFLQTVKDTRNNVVVPKTPLPIHPTPPAGRP